MAENWPYCYNVSYSTGLWEGFWEISKDSFQDFVKIYFQIPNCFGFKIKLFVYLWNEREVCSEIIISSCYIEAKKEVLISEEIFL